MSKLPKAYLEALARGEVNTGRATQATLKKVAAGTNRRMADEAKRRLAAGEFDA